MLVQQMEFKISFTAMNYFMQPERTNILVVVEELTQQIMINSASW